MANTPPKKNTPDPEREKQIASNRKAYHDYFILETYEAGIALSGTEIKSLRAGKVQLREAYARIENGELWLVGMHISPYEQAGVYFQHDPIRPRKLLLHHREIRKLQEATEARGLTLIPTRLYLKKGRAKLEIGVARGKHTYDKREALAERQNQRDAEREVAHR
jgi:SsrA-binding protein